MHRALQLFGNLANKLPRMASSKKTRAETKVADKGRSKQLELLLPFRWPDTDEQINWCVTEGSKPELQGQIANLDDLSDQYKDLPLTVYLDAADALIMQADLPAMSRKNLAKAIPYALEDRLLGDVEKQFFTWNKSNKNSDTSVCVIEHDRLSAILEMLKSKQLTPQAVVPVLFTSPMLDSNWTFVFNNTNAWIRTSKVSGTPCTVEDSNPPYALVKLLTSAKESDNAPTGLLLINAPDSIDAEDWASQLEIEIIIPEGHLWENMDRSEPAINLLQGPYTYKSSKKGSLHKLLPAAVIALVVILGNTGLVGWHWFQLHSEAQSVNKEMVSIFSKSFPEQAGTIIDPAAQMQSNLDRLRQEKGGARQGDFLSLLGPTSKALAENHITGLSNIRYHNGSILISIQLADYQALDKLKEALASKHLNVEVVEANSDATGVRAKLKLTSTQETAS